MGVEALSEQGALAYLSDSKIAEKMTEAETNARNEMSASLAASVSANPSLLTALVDLEEQGIVEAPDGVTLAAVAGDVSETEVLEPSALPNVTVPESTMYEIANRARQATAIQLTVYESDGETAIGTVPFNLM